MRGVLIHWIVGIKDVYLAGEQAVCELFDESLSTFSFLDGFTAVAQLMDKAIRADIGGAALFGAPTLGIVTDRLFIAGQWPIASGADDAAKPMAGLLIAGTNTVVGHELEVVCMGTDSQVRAARMGFSYTDVIGDVKI